MLKTTAGTVELNDGRIYYETAGEGPPVALVHAGIVDSRMWDEQWDVISRDYSVIRYDLRGFGRSDPVSRPVSRRQELYRVLDQAGVGRAALIGCSMSGETVLDAALESPDRVAGLVLVSMVPAGFEMEGEPPSLVMEMLAALEQGDLNQVSELQMRLWLDSPHRQPGEMDPHVRRRAAEMNRQALAKNPWGLAAGPVPDPLDPPAAQRLDEVQTPVLIIAGELDEPEVLRAAEVMAEAIPAAQKVILPGCAHLPNMEKPREFNQAVLDFLNRIL